MTIMLTWIPNENPNSPNWRRYKIDLAIKGETSEGKVESHTNKNCQPNN